MHPKYVAWNEVTLYTSAWLYDVHKTGAVSPPFPLDIYERGVKRVNRSFRMACGKKKRNILTESSTVSPPPLKISAVLV